MEKDPLLRREIYEKAKRFEERVAELFRLMGYQTVVDYKRNDQQFDVRLEKRGVPPTFALVECKDTDAAVGQEDLLKFVLKVQHARKADTLPYQPIVIARSKFVNNAHAVAEIEFVHLMTFQELVLSLVDLSPNLEEAIQTFERTPLPRLYVEQDGVFEADIRPGELLQPQPLSEMVGAWLDRPGSSFLTLLGDFGSGKTSFCKRLAWDLANRAKEAPSEVRIPILIDLREGGSTTVTLENLLTHHFQSLSSQPLNPQALLHLNREGHLLLIFDGFDETIAYTEPGRYVENLRQILRAAEGKAKVLLTCRTHYFRDRPEALRRLGKAPDVVSTQGATQLYDEIRDRPGAEIGYVLEFEERQIEEYLRKAFPPPADPQKLLSQIQDTYNLADLAKRPFLLEIIVKTLPRLLERQGDVTLADLYETYCESWFNHTDFRLTLTREKKVALVEYLAQLVWDSPENHVHYDLLFEKSAEFFKDRPLTIHDKERIDYEVRTALFLHRDAEGYYSFIHRSFLEFFIARTIRAGLAAGDSSCLALKRITREVAFFLEFWREAKQIPEMAGKVLEASYQPGGSENALFLLYFHARATLGPLVGPGREKDLDLLEIKKAFSAIKPASFQLPGADLEGASLPGIDLAGAMLEGARLSRANLRQASLDRADLCRANLSFVDFRQGSAEKTDLSDSDLNHLDAQEVSLRGAILVNANLSFARLTRADLSLADFGEIQTLGAGLLEAVLPKGFSLPSTVGFPKRTTLELRFQVGHSSIVRSVVWNSRGTVLATASADGTIKLWDASSGRLLNTLISDSSVNSVAWSPDGEILASGSDDKCVRLWEASSGRLLDTLAGHKNWVNSVAWSPDGERLASGSDDRSVRLWQASSGLLLRTLEGHEGSVNSVAWSPDGERLASGASDRTVRLWEASSGRLLNSLTRHASGVRSVAWSPDGERVASGSHRSVRLWRASSGRRLNRLAGHESSVDSIAWSPEGERLAAGSLGSVHLWEPSSGRLLNKLAGHESSVNSVAWSPDGKRLASGSYRSGRLWEASSGRLLNTLAGYEDWVRSVAWSPDGERLASGSHRSVRLWDASNGRLLSTLASHGSVFSIAWQPGGKRLASGSDANAICLWDASTGRLLNTLVSNGSVLTVVWSPDGKRLASASHESVQLWEASRGRLLSTLAGHTSRVRAVAWSSDGERLASGSDDKSVRLWEAASGRLLNNLAGHENSVFSVAWSLDGARLASGSADGSVRLWEAASGRLLNTLAGHENSVLTVSWSPDGERLASGSADGSVRLWEAASGRLLNTLASDSSVLTVVWSPDGQRLVLSSGGFFEVWDVQSIPPRCLIRLYHTPNGSGFAATPDGYVSGPPEALEYVRFGDGWALYDLTDVPERLSPERVAAALKPSAIGAPARRRPRKKAKT